MRKRRKKRVGQVKVWGVGKWVEPWWTAFTSAQGSNPSRINQGVVPSNTEPQCDVRSEHGLPDSPFPQSFPTCPQGHPSDLYMHLLSLGSPYWLGQDVFGNRRMLRTYSEGNILSVLSPPPPTPFYTMERFYEQSCSFQTPGGHFFNFWRCFVELSRLLQRTLYYYLWQVQKSFLCVWFFSLA